MPSRCRPGCSLEALDGLLATAGALTGQEADCLLDLRQLLRARVQPEAALALFYQVRGRLENRHYLALYRLRRWLENHIVAEFRASPEAAPITLPVRLAAGSAAAVRRCCLCGALQQGLSLPNGRLKFKFTPLGAGESPAVTRPEPGRPIAEPQ